MFNIEKLDKSIKEHLGEITEEQEAVLQYALDHPITEKELFAKLGIPEEQFGKFMQSFHHSLSEEGKKEAEEEVVFAQKMSSEELSAVTGGEAPGCWQGSRRDCLLQLYRHIGMDPYDDNIGCPNCANTVQDGSWCSDSDACFSMAIIYRDLTVCHKAWR